MPVHPTAIVEEGSQVASDAIVGPWCRVSSKAVIASGVELKSNVIVEGRTEIGPRTVIYPFAVIGGPPQHLGYRGEDTALKIGADCVIREHSTANLGTPAGRGRTVIGDRCYLMTGAHVAHDCIVGAGVIFANNATLGGHVVVEEGVFLGGLCAIHQNCRIGAYAFIGGCAAVTTDVIPYGSATGNHAVLASLNIVGMKRRGMPRAAIHDLRGVYRTLFSDEGSFQERIDAAAARYAHSKEAMRVIQFIREDTRRPLMAPPRKSWRVGENSE
ncbi:MAG TPA: acyl-[acyl-carrier-protein]--UDP-N-acetylglucosamine O-acyltransferase [Parvularcula sp.]|nr:acyl-[acyl-carrier-protein]--UDP-N-acetylglucosamine O-acyltransferase [Parvularcula sp.]HBS30757.1 acyl-[acyl-carrier-protein]--UDP-N-acetylglucosamine O-acyltransferase [Parvularcula sp.]HBS33488.1 acyl-[acyl-carrier-protein]--UDP-N-acetylglucosamine O-acyltransferase [Parvularcula sp.]